MSKADVLMNRFLGIDIGGTKCAVCTVGSDGWVEGDELMQKDAPDVIRRYVHNLVETFDPLSGGSWLYIEIDPGFS